MLQTLPRDILLEVFEYLTFKDICNLQHIRELRSIVNMLSRLVISKELRQFDFCISMDVMHQVIHAFCKQHLNKSKQTLLIDLSKRPNIPEVINVNHCKLNRIEDFAIVSNVEKVNCLFKAVFAFFIKNKSIVHFPDKFTLFVFYKLLEIDILKSYTNVRYNIRFLSNFQDLFEEVARKYFVGIDYSLLCIDDMQIVSRYCVTLPMLKKLFGIRHLDLSQADFIECCETCVSDNVRQICLFKYNRHYDYFLSANYIAIKDFLKEKARRIYRRMEMFEIQMISKHILIKHPQRNVYMSLTSAAGKRLFRRLKHTPPFLSNEYVEMQKTISQGRRSLKRLFFS